MPKHDNSLEGSLLTPSEISWLRENKRQATIRLRQLDAEEEAKAAASRTKTPTMTEAAVAPQPAAAQPQAAGPAADQAPVQAPRPRAAR